MFTMIVLGRGGDRQIHVVHWPKIQWLTPEEQQLWLPRTCVTPTPIYIHLDTCEHTTSSTTPPTHTHKVDDDLDVINARPA